MMLLALAIGVVLLIAYAFLRLAGQCSREER